MTSPVGGGGFEHGVATLVTSGGGIATELIGSPAVDATSKRTGNYGLHINTSSATKMVSYRFGGGSTAVFRVYFCFHSWPSVTADFCGSYTDSGDNILFLMDASTHTVKLAHGASLTVMQTASFSCSLDTWYRLEWKVNQVSNPWLIDWKLATADGVATTMTQGSYAATATQSMGIDLGNRYQATTMDLYIDDWLYSIETLDYPLGPGGTEGLSPSSDGTHNAGTNIMENQAGSDIGAVSAYPLINSVPIGNVTAYIKQSGSGTGNYAAVNFADIAATHSAIYGAFAILAYKAAGTQSDNGGCIVTKDGFSTSTTLWGAPGALADYSESTVFYKMALILNAKDDTTINALAARMGYSSDANPVPWWADLIVEVAYEISVGDELTATDITAGTPVLGAPTIGQTHALTSTNIATGVPVLDAPTLGQKHVLTSTDILSGTPVLGAPTLSIVNPLVATDITTGTPVLGAPTIGQKHILTANAIDSGGVVLGAPTIGQKHILTANGIDAGTPVLGLPTIGQVYALISTNIDAGTPVLGAPTIGQKHILTANEIDAATPVLGAPTIGQKHILTANGIDAASPVLGAPTIGQKHALIANGIDSGVVVLGAPSIGQKHALIANGIDATSPVLGAPSIGQTHILTSTSIVTGVPTLDAPILEESETLPDQLIPTDITSGVPTLGAPTIGQVHVLLATNITFTSPVLDPPTIGQIHNLQANEIITGIPVLDTSIIGQIHNLQSNDIITGIPVCDIAFLGQIHDLTSTDILTGIPVLGNPELKSGYIVPDLLILLESQKWKMTLEESQRWELILEESQKWAIKITEILHN